MCIRCYYIATAKLSVDLHVIKKHLCYNKEATNIYSHVQVQFNTACGNIY